MNQLIDLVDKQYNWVYAMEVITDKKDLTVFGNDFHILKNKEEVIHQLMDWIKCKNCSLLAVRDANDSSLHVHPLFVLLMTLAAPLSQKIDNEHKHAKLTNLNCTEPEESS